MRKLTAFLAAFLLYLPGTPWAMGQLLMQQQKTAGSIILSWAESGSANSYNVYRGISSGTETLYDSSLTTSYTDKRVAIGVLYYYKVTAVNAAGESARSNEASAVVL